MAWAAERFRRQGVHAVEVVGCTAAPYRRRLPAWCFYYRTADPELAEHLQHPAAWDPSSFDGDASL
jgi:hypothetical protein